MPTDAPLTPRELKQLRDRLDEIDTGIIDLIAERLTVVKSIGDHKLKTCLLYTSDAADDAMNV